MRFPFQLTQASRWNSSTFLSNVKLIACALSYLLLVFAVSYALYFPVLQG